MRYRHIVLSIRHHSSRCTSLFKLAAADGAYLFYVLPPYVSGRSGASGEVGAEVLATKVWKKRMDSSCDTQISEVPS